MRCIFPIIALFGFVLSSSLSLADEVKNVGLLCLRNVNAVVPIYEILWLEEDGKIEWYDRDQFDLDNDGDVAEIVFSAAFSDITSHRSTEEFIFIRMTDDNSSSERTDWNITIDRYSLKMITKIGKKSYTSKCEVFKNKSNFMYEIDRIIEQNEVILKNRKI